MKIKTSERKGENPAMKDKTGTALIKDKRKINKMLWQSLLNIQLI